VGSARKHRAKHKVAVVHRRTANQRKDFRHKLTTGLVATYDGICIEDLSVKGLAKTKLAKSTLDASLGEFRRQLEYKAIWNRRHLAVIDRWYPSSKTCHVCGRGQRGAHAGGSKLDVHLRLSSGSRPQCRSEHP
jgi:putative transposase